jgi:hypothetical protein
MGLLDMLPNSNLGLGGNAPQQFGTDPVPPNSLHDTFSTNGDPSVRWRTISGDGMRPQPSILDIGDTKDYYDPTYKYSDHKPE